MNIRTITVTGLFLIVLVIGLVFIYRNTNTERSSYIPNEKVRTDTPLELIEVSGRPKEILGLRVSNEYGRIFSVPENGMPLYVNLNNMCDVECLNSWKPYEAKAEITDGDLGTVFRSDTNSYQYTWKGSGLYILKQGSFQENTSGGEVSADWAFARP